jgi:cell division protein FtsB
MSTATLERLPNTVTACHTEIKKLREVLGLDAGSAQLISALESERDELKDQLEETKRDKEAAETRVDELEANELPDAVAAIDRFLNECVRVGPLRYDVPQSDRELQAIIGLHDAAGRRP